MNKKPHWKPNLGLRMFEWIKPSAEEIERAQEAQEKSTATTEEPRYLLPMKSNPAQGREMIFAPQTTPRPQRESGMFDWVSRSPKRPIPPPKPAPEEDGEITLEDIEAIPSIDGWRRRSSMAGNSGSSYGWLVGLSVAVGFGIAAALAYFSPPGQPKA